MDENESVRKCIQTCLENISCTKTCKFTWKSRTASSAAKWRCQLRPLAWARTKTIKSHRFSRARHSKPSHKVHRAFESIPTARIYRSHISSSSEISYPKRPCDHENRPPWISNRAYKIGRPKIHWSRKFAAINWRHSKIHKISCAVRISYWCECVCKNSFWFDRCVPWPSPCSAPHSFR